MLPILPLVAIGTAGAVGITYLLTRPKTGASAGGGSGTVVYSPGFPAELRPDFEGMLASQQANPAAMLDVAEMLDAYMFVPEAARTRGRANALARSSISGCGGFGAVQPHTFRRPSPSPYQTMTQVQAKAAPGGGGVATPNTPWARGSNWTASSNVPDSYRPPGAPEGYRWEPAPGGGWMLVRNSPHGNLFGGFGPAAAGVSGNHGLPALMWRPGTFLPQGPRNYFGAAQNLAQPSGTYLPQGPVNYFGAAGPIYNPGLWSMHPLHVQYTRGAYFGARFPPAYPYPQYPHEGYFGGKLFATQLPPDVPSRASFIPNNPHGAWFNVGHPAYYSTPEPHQHPIVFGAGGGHTGGPPYVQPTRAPFTGYGLPRHMRPGVNFGRATSDLVRGLGRAHGITNQAALAPYLQTPPVAFGSSYAANPGVAFGSSYRFLMPSSQIAGTRSRFGAVRQLTGPEIAQLRALIQRATVGTEGAAAGGPAFTEASKSTGTVAAIQAAANPLRAQAFQTFQQAAASKNLSTILNAIHPAPLNPTPVGPAPTNAPGTLAAYATQPLFSGRYRRR